MSAVVAILFIAALLYKLYAVPVGLVFAFFLTRSLIRKKSSPAAVWITLAWTVGLFTPLVIHSQTFFDSVYTPWYLAFLLSPPAPEFSFGAVCLAAVTSFTASAAALYFCKR